MIAPNYPRKITTVNPIPFTHLLFLSSPLDEKLTWLRRLRVCLWPVSIPVLYFGAPLRMITACTFRQTYPLPCLFRKLSGSSTKQERIEPKAWSHLSQIIPPSLFHLSSHRGGIGELIILIITHSGQNKTRIRTHFRKWEQLLPASPSDHWFGNRNRLDFKIATSLVY